MGEIIKAGIYIHWLLCPTDARPAPGYEWVLYEPAATQHQIKALDTEGRELECIWLTRRQKREGKS